MKVLLRKFYVYWFFLHSAGVPAGNEGIVENV